MVISTSNLVAVHILVTKKCRYAYQASIEAACPKFIFIGRRHASAVYAVTPRMSVCPFFRPSVTISYHICKTRT